jgi:hypothetical protein
MIKPADAFTAANVRNRAIMLSDTVDYVMYESC